MREDILETAAFATGLGLRVAMATNGTLVDPETARRIRRAGISRVSVSLDGAIASTHDARRGVEGSFEAALAGLRAVRAEGVSTQINMTVSRSTRAEVDDLFALAEREGADAVHLFLFVPVGCGLTLGEEEELGAGEVEEMMDWFHRSASCRTIESRLTCVPQYRRLLVEAGEADAGRPGGCLAGRSVCFISHDGLVYPCGYLPVEAGNVRERGLMEIWEESEVFAALKDPERLGPPCGLCAYRVACGGCRARAFAETGDYLEGDRSCIGPYRAE